MNTVHFSDYKYAWLQLHEMGFNDTVIEKVIGNMDENKLGFFVDSHRFVFTPATDARSNRVDWGNNTYIVNWMA